MRNKTKAFINLIKSHKIWSAIIGILLITIIYYSFFAGSNIVPPNFVLTERGNIKEIVSVTGNIKPFSDVNLAFERSGKVSNINIKVGDQVSESNILASINNDDLAANLDQAKANLKIAEIQFGQSQVGTTTIQNSKVDKATLDLAQAKISLVNSIKDSYTKADDAFRNKIYSLFVDPIKSGSKLNFAADSFLKEPIEKEKGVLEEELNSWYQELVSLSSSSDLDSYYNTAKTNLISIKTLLDQCATVVNKLSPNTSYSTQDQIDVWKLNVSGARTSIDTAISNLSGVWDEYQAAILALRTAESDFMVQGANIDQAKAGVASAEAELAKTIIKSPINGVITSIDAKLGEIVSANKNIISVISLGDYEVEAFVPEADISKVKINDLASTTLDAYGSSINFGTKVIKIDPAATIIEGVPTYKVTFKFINTDGRIKAGMTANLDILTSEKNDVLNVPARAIYSKNGDRYVKVLGEKNAILEIKIEVGLRGSDGQVEILSGLKEGDKVVTS